MARIEISECRLRLSRRAKAHEAPPLRSIFDRGFEEEVLAHNQGPNSQPIYQYPRVQFKLLESMALLLGINEGSELLRRIWLDIDQRNLGDEEHQVLDAHFETRQEEISHTSEPLEYRFLTPWLALNQKNFTAYVGSRNQRFRKDELSRILVGNILGLAKSLGIRFDGYVTADCHGLTSIKTSFRGKGMIGFVGGFSVNLRIPEHIGLGKSVAWGFGVVRPK